MRDISSGIANRRVAAIIFDVDGTLAETERDGHRVAFNRAFSEAGLGWYWDVRTYGRLLDVTGGKERLRHWWASVDAEGFARPDTEERIRAIHRRKTEIYGAIVRDGGVKLRPGVARLIAQARACGLRLAVATTTAPENVDALVASTLGCAASDVFEVIGAGDVVPAKKPAPDVYRWVLDRLGLGADEVIAIEDSGQGMTAATGAGIATLVTTGQYTRGPQYPGAIAVVDGLGEPSDPATGLVRGACWRGVVDVETLTGWAAHSQGEGPARAGRPFAVAQPSAFVSA